MQRSADGPHSGSRIDTTPGEASRLRGSPFAPRSRHLSSATIYARESPRAHKNRDNDAHMPEGIFITVAGEHHVVKSTSASADPARLNPSPIS